MEDVENVELPAEEGGGAKVEVELLGESVEEIDGNGRWFVCGV